MNQTVLCWEKIFFLDETTLLVECKGGYLQSADNGLNWTFISMPGRLWTNVVNSGLIYTLEANGADTYSTIGKLKISADKGLTWTSVGGNAFYGSKVSFFNKLHGIAYSNNILQYTNDGGRHWKLIVFPIKL
jgi:hypothetical protein